MPLNQILTEPVAVLYQANPAPPVDGIWKPMKPGGYSDSGADIGFTLFGIGIPMITPVKPANARNVLDWVFADTHEGIAEAIERGAATLWANTVLYEVHPLATIANRNIKVIGQKLFNHQCYDNKFTTSSLLKQNQLPVPKSILVGENVAKPAYNLNEFGPDVLANEELDFPLVVKPVRGRGSQGVSVVNDIVQLHAAIQNLIQDKSTYNDQTVLSYGNPVIVEEYLSGEEITLSIMPPGAYGINGTHTTYNDYWCLPVVVRIGHHQGIAPYSGEIAIVQNSCVADKIWLAKNDIGKIIHDARKAARLIGATAIVRIDCRQDHAGQFYIFDVNMKPNMTGPGRPGRADQDSLCLIAAKSIGWNYGDLLTNLLNQAKPLKELLG